MKRQKQSSSALETPGPSAFMYVTTQLAGGQSRGYFKASALEIFYLKENLQLE